MLRSKAIWLIIPTLLFTTPSNNAILPHVETEVQGIDLAMNVEIDSTGYYYGSKDMIDFKKEGYKLKIEKEKREAEEKRKKEEEEQKRLQEIEQNKKYGTPYKFLITYYGNTAKECGVANQKMANGEYPYYLACAVPYDIPLGSKLIINEKTFVACDRGNPKYICMLGDNYARIDIFIPRLNGESDAQYEDRIMRMGTDVVEGRLIIQ